MNTLQTKDKTRWLAQGKLSCMAVAAGLAFSAFQGFAQQVPSQPVKNIVLVHGAFADGSSWSKVIRILQAKGYNVTAVQNPLTSLADDVAATRRALALQNGPVILVGHSWAGFIITEAGTETSMWRPSRPTWAKRPKPSAGTTRRRRPSRLQLSISR